MGPPTSRACGKCNAFVNPCAFSGCGTRVLSAGSPSVHWASLLAGEQPPGRHSSCDSEAKTLTSQTLFECDSWVSKRTGLIHLADQWSKARCTQRGMASMWQSCIMSTFGHCCLKCLKVLLSEGSTDLRGVTLPNAGSLFHCPLQSHQMISCKCR